MRRMGFTKTECKQLIAGYEAVLERYRAELPINVYSKLIKTSTRSKLTALRQFVSNGQSGSKSLTRVIECNQ